MVLLGSLLILCVIILSIMMYAEFGITKYNIIVGFVVIIISIALIFMDNMAQKETILTTTKVYTDNINDVILMIVCSLLLKHQKQKQRIKCFLLVKRQLLSIKF